MGRNNKRRPTEQPQTTVDFIVARVRNNKNNNNNTRKENENVIEFRRTRNVIRVHTPRLYIYSDAHRVYDGHCVGAMHVYDIRRYTSPK